MEYRRLGHTGLKVSSLCLGAMTFGRETSAQESYRMLDCFKEAGGNFIDTANVYSAGTSEEILGRWLAASSRTLSLQKPCALPDAPQKTAARIAPATVFIEPHW